MVRMLIALVVGTVLTFGAGAVQAAARAPAARGMQAMGSANAAHHHHHHRHHR